MWVGMQVCVQVLFLVSDEQHISHLFDTLRKNDPLLVRLLAHELYTHAHIHIYTDTHTHTHTHRSQVHAHIHRYTDTQLHTQHTYNAPRCTA